MNINSMDRNDPYRTRNDFSVKSDYNLHDTRGAALGIDFCERPFKKQIQTPSLPDISDIHPAPLPWVWDPKLFTRQARKQQLK